MLQEIVTRQFFDGDTLQGPSRVILEDGIVARIEDTTKECDFFLLSPGLIDVQMNGFGGHDVATADAATLTALDAELASLGTTSWCGTIVTAPLERLSETIDRLHRLWTQQTVSGFIGIHVEGPFLGLVPGAHRPDWIRPIELSWLRSLPESVRLVTMGAEQQEFTDATQILRSKDIVVSIGHSRPTAQQFTDAISSGASMVTHLYNGMSGVHHRDVGLALLAMTEPEVTVGLIGDMVHVSPQAVALAFAAKGHRGVCLVSDSVAWESPWARARGVEVRNGAPRLSDDTLAGSSAPLSECVANAVHRAGVPLDQALRAATSTPADLLGNSALGRVRQGHSQDLVAFDESLHVVNTWRRLPSLRA